MEQVGVQEEQHRGRDALDRTGSYRVRFGNGPTTFVLIVLLDLGVATVVGGGPAVAAVSAIICVSLLPIRPYRRFVSGIARVLGDRDDERGRSEELRAAKSGEVDFVRLLVESDVLERYEHADRLQLDDGFEMRWHVSMAELGRPTSSDQRLRRLFGRLPERVASVDETDGYAVRLDEETHVSWESESAFRADLAAATLLETQCDEWGTLSVPARLHALEKLRDLLRRCPTCNGPIAETSNGDGEPEGSERTFRLACENCDATLRARTRLGWVT